MALAFKQSLNLVSRWDVQGDARWKPRVAKQVFAFLAAPLAIFIQPTFADTRSPCSRILLQLPKVKRTFGLVALWTSRSG